jgi:hypothetical protein
MPHNNPMNTPRGALRANAVPFSWEQSQKTVVEAATSTTVVKGPLVNKLADRKILSFKERVSKAGKGYVMPEYDIESLLNMPTNVQAATVEQMLSEAGFVVGHAFAGSTLISQLDWVLRIKSRTMKNYLSFSVANAFRKGERNKVSLLRDKVELLADRTELLFTQQEELVSIIRGITGEDYSIHPFHTHYEATQVIDNSDDMPMDDSNGGDDPDQEEFDDAAAFIREMEQKDMRVTKESTSSLFGDGGGSSVDPRISRESWIEELLGRTREDWAKDAAFAAWTVARSIMDEYFDDGKYAPTIDFLKSKQKPLAFYAKARRKSWDALAAVQSRERRIEFLDSLSRAMENDDAQLAIATVQGAKNDEEIMVMDEEVKELDIVARNLFDIVERMGDALHFARIDDKPLEFSAYETYLHFEPVAFMVAQHQMTVERVQNKRWTYTMAKAAVKGVREALGSPTIDVVEFKDDNGKPIKLWKMTWDEAPVAKKVVTTVDEASTQATLDLIRQINLLRYQHSMRVSDGEKTVQRKALVKAFAMSNKKKFVITDGKDDFLF